MGCKPILPGASFITESASKQLWHAPKVMEIEMEQIRESEEEIFLRSLENAELFRMLPLSGAGD